MQRLDCNPELSIVYKRKLDKCVVLVAWFSKMFYTESVGLLKEITAGKGVNAYFDRIMLSVAPTFFSGSNL